MVYTKVLLLKHATLNKYRVIACEQSDNNNDVTHDDYVGDKRLLNVIQVKAPNILNSVAFLDAIIKLELQARELYIVDKVGNDYEINLTLQDYKDYAIYKVKRLANQRITKNIPYWKQLKEMMWCINYLDKKINGTNTAANDAQYVQIKTDVVQRINNFITASTNVENKINALPDIQSVEDFIAMNDTEWDGL